MGRSLGHPYGCPKDKEKSSLHQDDSQSRHVAAVEAETVDSPSPSSPFRDTEGSQ